MYCTYIYIYIQVHFNWCIADPASEALPKSNLAICEVCVCVCII